MSGKHDIIAEPTGKSTPLDGWVSLLSFGTGHTPVTSEPLDMRSIDINGRALDFDDDLSKLFDSLRGQTEKPLEDSDTVPRRS